MYLEHVRLPQLHCRSKVLTPILLSNLSLSKEHFAVSQQSTTLLTAQYIYTRSLGNKTVQSKVFYRWPLKSCWRINAISPLHFQFFKMFEAQFEFYLVAKVQNANSFRITKNEQEKFQERLIYHLGLRNNIKEREMHGLHCSTVLIESKQILIFTTTTWRRKQSLLTLSLYFSFLLISPTWRVRWLPYQVATRFSMSLTSLLSPS